MSTQHTSGEPSAIGWGDRELVDGDVVGEYVIRDQLGKGGFGTVYRAQHPVIGKQVAIKVLSRRYSADEAIVARFVDEARAVNQIRHRNIIDIFSFGQLADGRHYYVMEYLDGMPLDRYLQEHGVLTLEAAMPILRAIGRALDAAHAKGIAHRDLKPENIVLSFDDEGQIFPKLLDFGIAKLTNPDAERAHRTGTGVPLGTPYYMSPEQCRGRDVDQRTDIYSFGVLTFRLLTGDYPFHGELIEILHKHMHEDPPLPSSINGQLTPDIDRAILAMLSKDPARRPPTVISAVVALQGDVTAPTPLITGPLRTATPGVLRRGGVQTADTLAASTGDTMAAATGDTMAAATGAPSAARTGTSPRPRTLGAIARPRSRAPLFAGIAVVIAGATGMFVWLQSRAPSAPITTAASGREAAPAPTPTPAVTPAPVVTPTPAPTTVTPRTVIVTITGAPDGAEVKVNGASRGVVPTVQLEHATSPTVLNLYADGYVPTSKAITPDRDQDIAIPMKKKPRGAPQPKRPSKDDIPHEIKGLTDQ
ncbi:MAG: serine/threonine protein kinase [Myxococcales bacterium]|nr:serine/threonine protein kinase [Myxococcales bacterium]